MTTNQTTTYNSLSSLHPVPLLQRPAPGDSCNSSLNNYIYFIMEEKKEFHSSPLTLLITTVFVFLLASITVPTPSPDKNLDDAALYQTDPSTGFAFARQERFLPALAGKKYLKLLGVGTRKKAILNVYSVGFYGDDKVLKEVNNQSSGKCATLLGSKGAKAALLRFNMGVGAEKMAEALSNVQGVGQDTKDDFANMILTGLGGPGEKFRKGESMTLEWKAPDRVFVTGRGSFLCEVRDKDLYQGLLDVYLGPSGVSPSLKDSIEKSM